MAKAALAEAERVEAEQRAKFEAPAKAQKARILVDAEAEAEKRRLEAQGEAAAIYAKLEAEARGQYEILAKKGEGLKQIVEACGGAQQAFQLMMLEHLDTLAETSAKAISNIKFDKVVVWENGGAERPLEHGRLPAQDGRHAAADAAGDARHRRRRDSRKPGEAGGRRTRNARRQRPCERLPSTRSWRKKRRRSQQSRGCKSVVFTLRVKNPLAEREAYTYFASCSRHQASMSVDRSFSTCRLSRTTWPVQLLLASAAFARPRAASSTASAAACGFARLRLPAASPRRRSAGTGGGEHVGHAHFRAIDFGRLAAAGLSAGGAASGFAFAAAEAASPARLRRRGRRRAYRRPMALPGFAPAAGASPLASSRLRPAWLPPSPPAFFASGFGRLRRRLVDNFQESGRCRTSRCSGDSRRTPPAPGRSCSPSSPGPRRRETGPVPAASHRPRRTCPCTRASSFRSGRKTSRISTPKQ